MWQRRFWMDAVERMVKTAVQSFAGALTATAVVADVNWQVVGWTVGVAVVGSLATSLASSQVGTHGDASAVK